MFNFFPWNGLLYFWLEFSYNPARSNTEAVKAHIRNILLYIQWSKEVNYQGKKVIICYIIKLKAFLRWRYQNQYCFIKVELRSIMTKIYSIENQRVKTVKHWSRHLNGRLAQSRKTSIEVKSNWENKLSLYQKNDLEARGR